MSIAPIGYRTSEAHSAIGCAPRAIKDALSRGELVSRRVGRRTFILREDLVRWAIAKPIARRTKQKDVENGQ